MLRYEVLKYYLIIVDEVGEVNWFFFFWFFQNSEQKGSGQVQDMFERVYDVLMDGMWEENL